MRKPSSFADVYDDFMTTTSVLGMNRIHGSPYRVQRVVWFCVVCAGLAGTAFHAQTMVAKYLSYPSLTTFYCA